MERPSVLNRLNRFAARAEDAALVHRNAQTPSVGQSLLLF
jgi:hypothetical protein